MTEEFNLSEKMYYYIERNEKIVSDVKEFIERETILLTLLFKKKIDWNEFLEKRDKLAGDKLI